MSSTWVDFRELREKLRFAEVLKHYGVELKMKGDRATGFCPLPGHERHSGKRRSPSFSAQLAKGMFQCFGCGAKGNVLDFAAYMEGVNPDDSGALREVALRLQDQFLGGGNRRKDAELKNQPSPSRRKASEPGDHGEAQQTPGEAGTRPAEIVVNSPLDFTLKLLDVEHPYLKQRGFAPETISYFGLGYCARGLMQGRIVIPMHDREGRLIGYAGRLADDSAVSADKPKYLFPSAREREGKRYEFHKSLLLFHGDKLAMSGPLTDLIVVEGFMSVFWMWQAGVGNVVALMGASCSSEQAQLICELTAPSGRIWVMPDDNEAGERCAASVLCQVSPWRFCRWAKLTEGKQPTDLSPSELEAALGLPPRQ